ncbi:MAG: phosphopyruvate hydratase [Candidatus ainarchaeum sp.]|nr:phosphopyruvate hydratase [Candidatus ainarchaeum sp.]MDD3976012.1 phosphopyruvate hydratase [Candidatus ainarchaeum sp.]
MEIKNIKAIRIIDSRGVPTIKTFVETKNSIESASVPSGTSSGDFEALELRDNSKSFFKMDVLKAIKNVNTIINSALKGDFVLDQKEIDNKLIKLDGTSNKSKLGANAILSVSLACAKVAAKELDIPLYLYLSRLNNTKKLKFPTPFLNIINGGLHSGGNFLAFQEFQIIPEKFKSFEDKIKASCEVYNCLKEIISKKLGSSSTNVGYEGGFVPILKKQDEFMALDLIQLAIDKLKYSKEISLGLDCAANSFYNKDSKKYFFDSNSFSSDDLINYYSDLLKTYNIKAIEDPFSETDKSSWKKFTSKFSSKIKIIGDDLLVTNPKFINQAIKNKFCNSLLLKVNQIGTLTESINSFNIAKKANWDVEISHRSGETEDTFIADLAYGLSSEYIKFGAPSRSERTSKYNRLIEIESFL